MKKSLFFLLIGIVCGGTTLGMESGDKKNSAKRPCSPKDIPQDPFTIIPDDCVFEVLSFVPIVSLACNKKVCKAWRDFIDHYLKNLGSGHRIIISTKYRSVWTGSDEEGFFACGEEIKTMVDSTSIDLWNEEEGREEKEAMFAFFRKLSPKFVLWWEVGEDKREDSLKIVKISALKRLFVYRCPLKLESAIKKENKKREEYGMEPFQLCLSEMPGEFLDDGKYICPECSRCAKSMEELRFLHFKRGGGFASEEECNAYFLEDLDDQKDVLVSEFPGECYFSAGVYQIKTENFNNAYFLLDSNNRLKSCQQILQESCGALFIR